MEECFWKEGISFLCSQCSDCCRHEPGHVFLYEEDIPHILDLLKMEKEVFFARYCRWVDLHDGFEYLSLNEKENYDCIFWNNGCDIYRSRPLQCKSFPFWPLALESKQNWDVITSTCSGCKCKNMSSSTIVDETSSVFFPTSLDGLSCTDDKAVDVNQSGLYFSADRIATIRNAQLNATQIKREKR